MVKSFSLGAVIGAKRLKNIKDCAAKQPLADKPLPIELPHTPPGMTITDGREAFTEAVTRHYALPKPLGKHD